MANSFANRWYCCRNARRRDDKVNSVSLLQTFCEFLCISMDSLWFNEVWFRSTIATPSCLVHTQYLWVTLVFFAIAENNGLSLVLLWDTYR